MKVIKLPTVFSSDLDLQAINQELQAHTAQLDWSAVTSVPESVLALLLAGLDISDHGDVLGIDGAISDTVIDQILAFTQSRSQPELTTREPQPSQPLSQPDPWTAPSPDLTVDPPEQSPVYDLEPLEDTPEASASSETYRVFRSATPVEIRRQLEERIIKDLHGPAHGLEEEVDEAHVTDRYLVGVLAPIIRNKKASVDADSEADNDPGIEDQPELQNSLALADKDNPEEGHTDTNVPTTDSMFPSSLGLTFCVKAGTRALEITSEWGCYLRQESEISFTEKGNPRKVWKRHPLKGCLTLDLDRTGKIDQIPLPDQAPSVYLRGQIRRLPDQDWIISLFLVNGQQEPSRNKDEAWLFQPQLMVRSADPTHSAIFLRKPLEYDTSALDPFIHAENQAMAMLYRNHVEFAVGHGVGVHAEIEPGHPTQAVCLATRVLPSYEVPATKPPTQADIPVLAGLVLDMKQLAEASPTALQPLLQPLVTAYAGWIDGQEARIADPDQGLAEYQTVAQQAIANCRRTLGRIEAGLNTLRDNPQAAKAFQFMNRAMWQQRIHSAYAEGQRRGETVSLEAIDIPTGRSWYPFQLAFILLNLPSTTDLNHPERSHPNDAVADLLWFPTGGGKTEAYLGLTAYTIGLRRLQGVVEGRDGLHGVAVLMRYTLRLLTLQQFQRATALICACEMIRRTDPQTWGSEPFRIGLWVGMRNTPNKTSDSEEMVKQHREGRTPSSGTPHQLTNCPWCGTKIDPGRNIHVERYEKGRGRTLVKCGDSLGRCDFSKEDGLPVVVVDEEIYRLLPTLLIATVDKFAQMPWKGEVQMLFGQVNGYCQRHGFRSPDLEDSDRHNKVGLHPAAKTIPHNKLRPPDLIIQDELHLISGPLGTLVGLYETAVDQLCTWQVKGQSVRPKVIASTATIRQAQSQVRSLFLRNLSVFPPQGLDIKDNFFSRQRDIADTPGRRYLGVCAPGRRLKATIIRVYLAVLSSAQSLYEIYGEQADPWMTLVGYFNSLRELGGTRRLVDDDIRTRLARMDDRGLAKRYLNAIDELTSRKDSTEIPALLDRLEMPFNPQLEAENKIKRKAGERVNRPDPLDVILATNMISVGVDIRRLGIMVACGQPKNTAEYIQATSRVGRSFPGLVITIYNWARPRDLSHYEQFEHYHATFYQNVEALSVTPFAPGATYRGLFALLVSLIRLAGEDFNGNDRALAIDRNHPFVHSAIEAIVQRAGLVADAQTAATIRAELASRLDDWLTKANTIGGAKLKYQVKEKDGVTVNLLIPAGQGKWEFSTCLNSLRNVEPTVNLVLTDQAPDDDHRIPQPYIESL